MANLDSLNRNLGRQKKNPKIILKEKYLVEKASQGVAESMRESGDKADAEEGKVAQERHEPDVDCAGAQTKVKEVGRLGEGPGGQERVEQQVEGDVERDEHKASTVASAARRFSLRRLLLCLFWLSLLWFGLERGRRCARSLEFNCIELGLCIVTVSVIYHDV